MDVSRRLRREATADDRSWARLLVRGAIDRHGELATPSVLVADEGMRSSNLAAALLFPEARKLIVRTPDTKGPREIRLRLSATGQRFLDDSRARGAGMSLIGALRRLRVSTNVRFAPRPAVAETSVSLPDQTCTREELGERAFSK
jgi:hypothetical protein